MVKHIQTIRQLLLTILQSWHLKGQLKKILYIPEIFYPFQMCDLSDF